MTIDVRLTETANQSTDFIKVKPGSDGYLALGVARHLVETWYVDREFIARYTQGFEELVKHLEDYTLDRVEEVTGVPKRRVAEFAEELATSKPFAILIGYGLQRRFGGGEVARSIALLPALLGMHRGFFYSNASGLSINLAAVDAVEECLSMGVSEVYLAYMRSAKEAPAGMHRIKELAARGAKLVELAQPKRVVVENGYARAVEFLKVQLGPPDETGRPRPVPIPGTEFTIEADLVIVAVGEVPTPPIYAGELAKYVDPSGRLSVGSDYRVPDTNIFAVGDVVTGPSKIGLAIEHALKAVRAIDSMLSGERVRVADMVKRVRPPGKPVLEFALWSSDVAKSVCDFLSTYAEVGSEECLSMVPFLRVFDYGKCMGCETCNVVCNFIHNGRSYMRVRKTAEGLVFPTACLHCANAKCQASCKRDAIVRGSLGEVLIDMRKCNKCLDCLSACPVRAIRISRGDIVNCDLCLPLRQAGLSPACLTMCPSRAIKLVKR